MQKAWKTVGCLEKKCVVWKQTIFFAKRLIFYMAYDKYTNKSKIVGWGQQSLTTDNG